MLLEGVFISLEMSEWGVPLFNISFWLLSHKMAAKCRKPKPAYISKKFFSPHFFLPSVSGVIIPVKGIVK